MNNISAGDVYRSEGIQMFITYALDERRDPTVERWCFARDEHDPNDGYGWLEIRVREIVPTQDCGTLVVYHRQWFTPECEPLNRGRRVVGSLASLKTLIRRRSMQKIS